MKNPSVGPVVKLSSSSVVHAEVDTLNGGERQSGSVKQSAPRRLIAGLCFAVVVGRQSLMSFGLVEEDL